MGVMPWLVFLLTVLVDQSSKVLVEKILPLQEPVRVIGSLVQITYIRNPKGAFGLPLGGKPFFVVFSVLASLLILYVLLRMPRQRMWSSVALTLVLGGAVGNLIDRLRFGEVIDFIDIGIRNTRWPIFNAADIAVSAGVALLVYALVFGKES